MVIDLKFGVRWKARGTQPLLFDVSFDAASTHKAYLVRRALLMSNSYKRKDKLNILHSIVVDIHSYTQDFTKTGYFKNKKRKPKNF